MPPNQPNVTLRSLESLVISRFAETDTENDLYTNFIWKLDLPALKRLRVCDIAIRPNPVSAISHLLRRSNCSPEEICIMGGRTQDSNGYQWYSEAPECDVWFDDDDDEFEDKLEQKLSRDDMVKYGAMEAPEV
uniref:F-box domain-containing protein n=1 Tax=Mycena chlorophos TaxID=658473 RepID=A0ABQ0LT54_MYCCL|nr:predicted protein [Mycena chlorophos]